MFRVTAADDKTDVAHASGPIVTESTRDSWLDAFSAQAAVFSLNSDRTQGLCQVEWAYRFQVDRTANGTLNGLGDGCFDHVDGCNNGRIDIFEIDTAATGTGTHGGYAVYFDPVGVGAADLHARTDTRRTGNLDTCHIFENFSEVLIRQLTDILRDDDFLQIDRIAFLVNGIRQRSPDAGNHDFLYGFFFLRKRCRRKDQRWCA